MDTIKKLQLLVETELQDLGITLEGMRTGRHENPFPVGNYNLFYLMSAGKLSLKKQGQLIEYFGFKYELRILDYEF